MAAGLCQDASRIHKDCLGLPKKALVHPKDAPKMISRLESIVQELQQNTFRIV